MSQPSQPRAGPSREISTATVLSPDGAATATTAYSGPTNEPKEDQGKKRKTAGWRHFVAGGVGGMTGAIVTSPFDVVKTRLQSDLFREASHPAPPKTNFLPHRLTHALPIPNGRPTGARGLLWNFVETSQMIRNIYVQEGPRALFKGLGPTLVGVVPARAINFSTYAQSKTFLAGHFPQLAAEGAVTGTDGVSAAEASPYIHLSAATIAGITTATVTNPIWVVKTRLQLDARHKENQEQALSRQRAAAGAGAGAGSGSRSTLAATASQIRSYSKKAVALEKPTAVGRKMLPAFSMTIDIMKKEGLPGLYKGLSASYLGVTEGVIQWVLYEVRSCPLLTPIRYSVTRFLADLSCILLPHLSPPISV